MNIFGKLPTGPFASEIHNANDHSVFPQIGQYGSIFFDDGQGSFSSLTSVNYTGLLPINDTTPAIDYTFNDFADDQSFTASDGPTVLGFDTIQFANTPFTPPPTFETTNVANKTNIVFVTPGPTTGINGVVDIPTASTGLASLTFDTPTGGDNNVSFLNTPPGVVTSLNGGSDEDVTNVTGLGVAAGTVLFLNGGGSTNTLNYDSGGETPTITPGLLPGEVLISIPGAGIVDAINYQQINITGLGPLVITPGPAVTINSVEGFQNVDAIVGTFTVAIPAIPAPAGFPASDFTASIDWGDPSVDPSAGTITQDASNPSIYYITGTHTFVDTGVYTVGNTVAFCGRHHLDSGGRRADLVHLRPGGSDRRHSGHRRGDPGTAGRLGLPDRRDRRRDYSVGTDRDIHRWRWRRSGRGLFCVDLDHQFERILPLVGRHHNPEQHRGPVHSHRSRLHAA